MWQLEGQKKNFWIDGALFIGVGTVYEFDMTYIVNQKDFWEPSMNNQAPLHCLLLYLCPCWLGNKESTNLLSAWDHSKRIC